jgi:hypothetical protein
MASYDESGTIQQSLVLGVFRLNATEGAAYCVNDGCEVIGHRKDFRVCPKCKSARQGLHSSTSHLNLNRLRPISVYRQVKRPYRIASKATALNAGKRKQVECPYRVAGKASAISAGDDIPKSA